MRDRDEALAELAGRYFTSHGPATLRDYVWWSGLTVREARLAVELAGLARAELNSLTYWFAEGAVTRSAQARTGATIGAFLLPNYDEYLIAYRDRGSVTPPVKAQAPPSDPFPHHLVLDGRVIGAWRRTEKARSTGLQISHRRRLTPLETAAIRTAVDRYSVFARCEVSVAFVGSKMENPWPP